MQKSIENIATEHIDYEVANKLKFKGFVRRKIPNEPLR